MAFRPLPSSEPWQPCWYHARKAKAAYVKCEAQAASFDRLPGGRSLADQVAVQLDNLVLPAIASLG